jgi:tetratricopeptide (TPR) repeat protein
MSEAEAAYEMGRVAEQRQDWQRAVGLYRDGLATAPESPELHQAIGMARYALGDRDEALRSFRRAAELDPTLAVAFRSIGLVYVRHGRPREAVAALLRARDIEEGGSGKTWELLGKAYTDLDDVDLAMDAYRRAIALHPERLEHYHNLAALHESAGQPGEAERLYREVIARDPKQMQARYNLGYLLLDEQRYQEAATTIEALLVLQPDNAQAYINLASAYLNLDRSPSAAEAYERFLELYEQDDAVRRKVVRQLRLLRAEVD